MKRSKFTEAQIAFILRQGEEGTVDAGSLWARGSVQKAGSGVVLVRGRRSARA
jgi:hypothetical protein